MDPAMRLILTFIPGSGSPVSRSTTSPTIGGQDTIIGGNGDATLKHLGGSFVLEEAGSGYTTDTGTGGGGGSGFSSSSS